MNIETPKSSKINNVYTKTDYTFVQCTPPGIKALIMLWLKQNKGEGPSDRRESFKL